MVMTNRSRTRRSYKYVGTDLPQHPSLPIGIKLKMLAALEAEIDHSISKGYWEWIETLYSLYMRVKHDR